MSFYSLGQYSDLEKFKLIEISRDKWKKFLIEVRIKISGTSKFARFGAFKSPKIYNLVYLYW
jgi:hypothetical protein